MKFVEVVEGFSIRIESIVSVRRTDETTLLIETENREYTVVGDFAMFVHFIEQEEKENPMLKQFFGG